MEAYIKSFLKKFVAALYLSGVETIPFSENAFQAGMKSMEDELKKSLPEEEYNMLSDIFVKSPVLERYNNFMDLLVSLNGDVLTFAEVNNPYQVNASIRMNDYYAQKILKDQTVCKIDSQLIKRAAKKFCEAADVTIWATRGAFMNLYEALNSAEEGNFVTHRTFGADQSLHYYSGKYYYEDGAGFVSADFLESQDWAREGWCIKYAADRIDREELQRIHENNRGYVLPEGSYESCLKDEEAVLAR